MTDTILKNDIVFSSEELKCFDAKRKEYLLMGKGENGWTLCSEADLNRLVRNMEDEGMKVE